jgi:hypothetical protein
MLSEWEIIFKKKTVKHHSFSNKLRLVKQTLSPFKCRKYDEAAQT